MKKIIIFLVGIFIFISLSSCNNVITFYVYQDESNYKIYEFENVEDVDIPYPTLEGYTFEGWYFDK